MVKPARMILDPKGNTLYQCSRCSGWFMMDEFHRRSWCKRCERERQSRWHRENPKASKIIIRTTGLKAENIDISTIGDFDSYLKNRLNKPCKICKKLTKVLHTDHNHETRAYRGLICFRCNLAIGHMEDNPWMLRRAALYLERKIS